MPERHRRQRIVGNRGEANESPPDGSLPGASPPTYDCSPAVAVATAALDGRRSYLVERGVCVYLKS